MRIVYLSQSYPPMVSGAALVVHRLAEGIAARGHSVLVLAASDRGRAYTEERGALRIARLRSLPNPMRVGQHFLLWPQNEVAAELHAFKPDIVHSHDPLVVGLSALRALRTFERRTACVLTVHQLPWFVAAYAPPLPGLRPAIESALWSYGNWLYEHFDCVVTPSRMIADIVAAHTRSRPQPISNGVDVNRFNPTPAYRGEGDTLRRKYGLDPDLPIILYAGRIDADKRVDLVVRATTQALRSINAQLLIVGDGKQLKAVIKLSEALGIRQFSHFPGFVSAQGDLPGLYRTASVFITASEVEIQSSVVLEAAATGLPVVTVRASSMPEFVEDGVTGYLVPPRHVESMANWLVTLLQNPDRARAMGEAGLAITREHSHESALDAHERLYESLIRRL